MLYSKVRYEIIIIMKDSNGLCAWTASRPQKDLEDVVGGERRFWTKAVSLHLPGGPQGMCLCSPQSKEKASMWCVSLT